MLNPADVTACLVTRGNVDMEPIIDSLIFENIVVWDNSLREDFKVLGRFKAAAQAETPVVYFQDDDCIVPERVQHQLLNLYEDGVFLSNMADDRNRQSFPKLCWLGWGSLTRADLPTAAFDRWAEAGNDLDDEWFQLLGCDIVFSLLTPTRRTELGEQHLPYAFGDDRLYKRSMYHEAKERFYREAENLAVRLGL